MLPRFLIVGASRSGTSTLHRLLCNSGKVYMPAEKELHFFNDDRRFMLGDNWYQAKFKEAKGQVAGEASPPYFHRGILLDRRGNHRWDQVEDAPARAAALLPKAKIVITLRNPIDRAQSQFWKSVWQGRETVKNFDQAVAEEMAGRRSPQQTELCWLYKNTYSVHVSRWVDFFGRDRVLLLNFDEWTRRPAESMQQLERFLDLPIGCLTSGTMAFHRQNSGLQVLPSMRVVSRMGKHSRLVRSFVRRFGTRPGYPEVSTESADRLRDYFGGDIQKLEEVTGENFSEWLWR